VVRTSAAGPEIEESYSRDSEGAAVVRVTNLTHGYHRENRLGRWNVLGRHVVPCRSPSSAKRKKATERLGALCWIVHGVKPRGRVKELRATCAGAVAIKSWFWAGVGGLLGIGSRSQRADDTIEHRESSMGNSRWPLIGWWLNQWRPRVIGGAPAEASGCARRGVRLR